MTAALATAKNATLPTSYEDARAALQKCARVDECKAWADKARAVATYAKMADDETLFRLATKIKARAIRRMGDLLNETKPAKGGELFKKKAFPTRAGAHPSGKTRKSAAKDAGLSEHQRKQAQRISNLSEHEFEKAMNAPDGPATLEALADKGKKSKPKPKKRQPSTAHLQGRDPAEYNAAIHLFGAMDRFIEQTGMVTPKAAVRGSLDHEYPEIRQRLRKLATWTKKLQAELEKKR